jgi:hypothetical protein
MAMLAAPQRAVRPSVSPSNLPLGFEPNDGQFDPGVRFLCRTPELAIYFTTKETVLALDLDAGTPGAIPRGRRQPRARQTASASFRLEGASYRFAPEGVDPLPGAVNYLIGNDRSRWHTGITWYQRVRYREVYPGIDLLYYGNGHSLEYDFHLAPRARLSGIALSYDGFDDLRLNAQGDLVLVLHGREIVEHRPAAYQTISGRHVPVSVDYRLDRSGKRVGFVAASYDHTIALVIDPVLQYGTFFGGSGDDGADSLAVDSSGNAYITGRTSSANLPKSPGTAFQPSLRGATDAFVAKLNASGTALEYVTYLGSSGSDEGTSIAVDAAGIAYVCGIAGGPDFPARGALSPDNSTPNQYHGGASDAFAVALSSNGSDLIYSVLLGGPGNDIANALIIDANSNVFVTGSTGSTTFTGVGTSAAQSLYAGGNTDAFVLELSKAGSLVWATFYGGAGDEIANAIGYNSSSGLYVVGDSTSKILPKTSSGHKGARRDIFLLQLSASGSFLGAIDIGGSGDQSALAVVVDGGGNAYLTGYTNSSDYPVLSPAVQLSDRGGYDAVVTMVSRYSPFGQSILFSTYLGGQGTDLGWSVALDSGGDLYVAGFTASTDFLAGPYPEPQPGFSTFVVELSFMLSFQSVPEVEGGQQSVSQVAVVFATYLGAADTSYPVSLAVRTTSKGDDLFLAGWAANNLFLPLGATSSLDPFAGGSTDAFLVRFTTTDLQLTLDPTAIGPYVGSDVSGNFRILPGADILIPLVVSNQGSNAAENVRVNLDLPSGVTLLACLDGVQCTVSRNTVTIYGPSFPPQSSNIFRIAAKTSVAQGTADVRYDFVGRLFSNTVDYRGANNIQSRSLTVSGQQLFALSLLNPVTFPDVPVGQSKSIDISITNLTQKAISFRKFGIESQTVFTLSPAASSKDLGPLQKQTYSIVFTPPAAGNFNATFSADGAEGDDQSSNRLSLTGKGTQPVTVTQVFSQITDGSGFRTKILLVNGDTTTDAPFTLHFWPGKRSTPGIVPAFKSAPGCSVQNSIWQGTIPKGGSITCETTGSASDPRWEGWGELNSSASVGGMAVYGISTPTQDKEGAVRLKPPDGSSFLLPFDCTQPDPTMNQFVTSMAIIDPDPTNSSMVTVTAFDESGNPLVLQESYAQFSMPPRGHDAFETCGPLGRFSSALDGKRGVLIFSAQGGPIAGLGLRFSPLDTYTSIETLTTGAPSGKFAQIAEGGGSWQTFLTAINMGTSATHITFTFHPSTVNLSNATLNLAVPLAFTGPLTYTTPAAIPPNGSVTISTAGSASAPVWQGSADVTSENNVPITGFAVFRSVPSGSPASEGSVPFATGGSHFLLPFDNTDTYASSFALVSPSPSNISVAIRDTNGQNIGTTPINNFVGHTASDSPSYFGVAGKAGILDFTNTSGLDIFGVGVLINPHHSFTALPIIRP